MNHSLAVPELCPPPKHVLRTDRVMLNVSSDDFVRRNGRAMEFNFALLKPLLPLATSSTSLSPILLPLINNCAFKSNRRPTASLFLSPTQIPAVLGP